MTERVADRKADPDMVAFKLMTWSWKLNNLQRGGLTARQFVRYCPMQLQLGENLTHVRRVGERPIASVEEVSAAATGTQIFCLGSERQQMNRLDLPPLFRI